MKIAISAGHYPAKPGAVFEGRTEHELALPWRDALAEGLRRFGLQTVLVAPGTLTEKIRQVNSENCDLALEIHFNAAPSGKASGSETLYYPGSDAGKSLANAIQKEIASLCAPNRGAKEGWYRMDRPGHSDYPGDIEGDEVVDAWLRLTNCTALILEPYFMSEIVKIETKRYAVCNVIASAVWSWADDGHKVIIH